MRTVSTSPIVWCRLAARPAAALANLTELRPCPLCGSPRDESVFELEGFQFYSDLDGGSGRRVDLRQARCQECGALFMNPAYTERGFAVLFEEAGASHVTGELEIADRARWVMEVARPTAGSTVVDLGCHDGRVLARLDPALRRFGVERDAHVVRACAGLHPGVELRQGTIEELSSALGGVEPDLVCLFHVLEHLRDPLAALRALRRTIPLRSRLAVEVPVLDLARGRDIVGFLTVQHLTHFSKASLARALAATGWEATEASGDESGWRVLARPAPEAHVAVGPESNDESRAAAQRYLAEHATVVAAVRERLARLPRGADVAIFGAGNHVEYLERLTPLFRDRERRFALFDSDPLKQGRAWRGIAIHTPALLREVDWAKSVLVLSSFGSRVSMAEAARSFGVPAERIVSCYEDA